MCKILDTFAIKFAILGDAKGVDTLAIRYCRENGIPHIIKKANWALYGKSAGPIRNGKMLDERPELLIALLHRRSRGTANMIGQATRRMIPVEIFHIE